MQKPQLKLWLCLALGALSSSACATEPRDTSDGNGVNAGTGGASGVAAAGLGGTSGGAPIAGASGAAGVGIAGAAGTSGASGAAGASGASGASGAAGVSGASGAAGVSGASGASGAAGVSGMGGMSGMAGASGASGMSGEGGASGMSGEGGASGAAGDGGDGGSNEPHGKFVGNITTSGQVRSDFIQYWDQLTPENEGKWGSVEGTRDQMNWNGLDNAYQYAMDNDIPFKQHTFVWGSQQPGWIAGIPQNEQREEVEEWIRLYCERYPDTHMIDVVNEPPPHTTPPYAQALGGNGASGWDWIVQSFEWARQYCPNAILILNDYNIIEYGDQNAHFIDIVEALLAADAPIDAVGAQAHAAFNVSTQTVRTLLDNLAATGLPVYISEYDIDLSNDEQQRQIMEQQFTMFYEHEDVVGITLWGYIEGRTWLANSGLMSEGGQQRPAMTWLMDYLGR